MALSFTLIVLSLLVPILASLVYVVSTHFDGIISAIKGNQILQTFVFGSASGSLVYCLKLIWDQVWGKYIHVYACMYVCMYVCMNV